MQEQNEKWEGFYSLSKEMIDALGAYVNNHRAMLFYDSFFPMKRWAFLMDNTDIVAFTRFWQKKKINEFTPERIGRRFRICQRFYPEDRKPLEIINKNHHW